MKWWSLVNEIQKLLSDNNIMAEVWADHERPIIRFEINWGDWKHDHLRANLLVDDYLNSKGIPCSHHEAVTEEDGSDCYSAQHVYIVTI